MLTIQPTNTEREPCVEYACLEVDYPAYDLREFLLSKDSVTELIMTKRMTTKG